MARIFSGRFEVESAWFLGNVLQQAGPGTDDLLKEFSSDTSILLLFALANM